LTDLVASAGVVGILVLAAAAYIVRVRHRGTAHFERVETAGSSALLGQGPMQMAYWALAPIGRALARRRVSANSITLSSLVLGAAAGVALAAGHFGVGAALSAASALGDALDGFVARESGTASDAGETLDAAVDRYNEFFFLGGLAIFYRASVPALLLVLGALLGSFMVSYATAKAEALQVVPPRGSMRRAERATYLTVAAALVPFLSIAGYDVGGSWVSDAPMFAALSLVAVVANVSAARRLLRTAELTLLRKTAMPSSERVVGREPSDSDTGDVTALPERSGREAGDLRSIGR
jgi:phosphatidylglycerophosphate synthase